MTSPSRPSFRGSNAGACMVSLVAEAGGETPEPPPPEQQVYLDDGHHFQDVVLDFMAGPGGSCYVLDGHRKVQEWEFSYEREGYTVTGHLDHLHPGPAKGFIIEVKALRSDNYKKLAKAKNMRSVLWYSKYVDQVQTYMSRPRVYKHPTGDVYRKGVDSTILVFKNRDTGEMMGGDISIDHPAFQYREDMVILPDPEHQEALEARRRVAVDTARSGITPVCDEASAYCFYCGAPGQGKWHRNRSVIEVDNLEDPELGALANAWNQNRIRGLTVAMEEADMRKEWARFIRKYKADVLRVVLDNNEEVTYEPEIRVVEEP